MSHERHPSEAELTRLADGSLPPEREARLRARVDESPELASALEEQRRAISLLRSAADPAPPALRARVREMTAEAPARRSRRARLWRIGVLPGAAALAVAAAAIVVALGGGTAAPTVPAAVRLTLASATLPAPGVDHANPSLLSLQTGGIWFPSSFGPGWKVTGARTDAVGGRTIVTVYYEHDGMRVGYAIVSGPALRVARHQATQTYDGTSFTFDRDGKVEFVTWVQSGHTCVVAGPSVGYRTLQRLVRGSA